jgi:hypothetical protein
MPAADCERLIDGFLAQPVNALSSLAFVLVGVWVPVVVRRRPGAQTAIAWAFGIGLVLVGIGSVAFHGPGGTTADWVHDGSITALLVLIVALEIGYRAGWSAPQVVAGWVVSATALVAVAGIWPGVGDRLNAPLGLFGVLSVVGPRLGLRRTRRPDRRSKPVLIGLAMLGMGAIIMLLSRTGGPLCVPDGLVQGHAIWHVLAATGLGLYAASGFESAHTSATASL